MNKKIGAIVAIADNGVMGDGLNLPWAPGSISGDLPHFKRVTHGSSILMGANTHKSIPGDLPGRVRFVVSKNLIDGDEGNSHVYPSLESALGTAAMHDRPIWIIGGAQLLQYALKKGVIDRIWVTRVHGEYSGDVFLNWTQEFLIDLGFVLTFSESMSDGLATKEFWGKLT